MKNIAHNQNQDFSQLTREPNAQFSRPVAWEHTFYLVGTVEEPSKYTDWFDTIRNAGPDDTVMININSHGGVYSTAIQFRRAIMESAATVVANIEGECHSAASIIFLSADAFGVSEGSNMLVHDYSGVTAGKGSEMIRQIQHEKVCVDAVLAKVYEDFLNKDELAQVLGGQDLWLSDDEILERVQKMVDERIARMEEEAEEAAEATSDEEEQPQPSKKRSSRKSK